MNKELFKKTIETFDEINSKDPNLIEVNGEHLPRELVYARWLSEWIIKINPTASEALQLSARCQHIKRWEIPRSSYPEGLKGYNKWKKDLADFHAKEAEKVLREKQYDIDTIEKVKSINLKKNIKADPDVQTMEDALCLVTLEHQIDSFSAKHDDEKMIGIIKKTWSKMSDKAKQEALKLNYSKRVLMLIQKALTTA
jgi:hypothetical protein